ncbi:tumor necrosis factor ligand superfamily member 11 [Pungitius pungitius]|uniref:tumor necrosis factor ligand superfamily member 11 n=1 Tax=Pungitius pungitius TaxID=134920 RepID=UPI001886CBF3|nr:tumor necrosis factor ligand superfamily member 11 [Pungitius pungitius]
MAATHGEYRGYLRNTVDVEAGEHRFHPVQSSETTYRPLLFGTLAVMGLLQVASSVAILLHLTGYLQEVDLSTAPHRPIEEVQTEPVLNALRDPRRKGRCKPSREVLPSAHLPISTKEYYPSNHKAMVVAWDPEPQYRNRMGYADDKLQVLVSGFYYIYTKFCFRYYSPTPPPGGESNTQLIHYVYHESIKQNSKATLLMKAGSTMRLNVTTYNMYCTQQGRGVRLDEGDALLVKVSNAWMLDREGEGTYFGAIKLGN